MIDLKQLVDAGVHFGHQKSRWCPDMEPYIWGHRGGIHLIDVSKTASALKKAESFLESVAARGETILWVGTKKAAKDHILKAGSELGLPYVDYRWVGGIITNFHQVKKAVTKLMHYEDIVEKSQDHAYTKKELVRFQKLADRLKRSVGGLKALTMPIGAVVVIDAKKEQTALLEANAAGVPVVALVDTNTDPSGIDIVIPGNDDSSKSIKLIMDQLTSAVKRGQDNKIVADKKAVETSKDAKGKFVAKEEPKKTPVKKTVTKATDKTETAKKEIKEDSAKKTVTKATDKSGEKKSDK